ncbi:hat family dimerization domaincontaining protein-related [Holotrichia oblita]|uniref:Hat family dimerization domaincontaining protein-related n=1 Tax=Holotrichia oblita TaxID=644536 RepID=A0ACB9TMH8_HOLOL|nr:hat family dimerization domaincontaining protein-related [Holotrichia oblita]
MNYSTALIAILKRAPDGKDLRWWITEDSPHKLYWKKAFGIINMWHFRRITKTGQRMIVKYDLQSTNCEEDDSVLLSNLKCFLEIEEGDESVENAPLDAPGSQTATNKAETIANDIAAAVCVGNVQILSVAYVSGFIANRILKEINNCDSCLKELTGMELSCNQFILFKEYSDNKKITYPSESLVIAMLPIHNINAIAVNDYEPLEEIRHQNIERRALRDASDPFTLNDAYFMDYFRLNKGMARYVFNRIFMRMNVAEAPTAVPPITRFFATLYFYATGSYQRTIGESLNIAICQQSASNAITEVTRAILVD